MSLKPEILDGRNGKSTLSDIGLLILSAVIFTLSFPNVINIWGFFPLAFFALIPVFIIVHRAEWVNIFFYGAFYGFFSYCLLNFWLISWHPLAIFFVPNIYACYFFLLFPVLKLFDYFFPVYGYLLQTAAWIVYEYGRTLGFLGYCYGIVGYSQYLFIPFIQIADITGIWGVSSLVVLPSAYLGNALKEGRAGFFDFIKKNRYYAFAYGFLVIIVMGYGFLNLKDFRQSKKWKIALIQQNIDPWLGGLDAYSESLDRNISLTEQALNEYPSVETIIWSETAFVPGILWHSRHQYEFEKWKLVRKLLDYFKGKKTAFIIGNNDEIKKILPNGSETRLDYNAVIQFSNGEINRIYRKFLLVPFSENFPYRSVLTWLHQILLKANIHYYEKGNEYTVFQLNDIKYSTPICFEDSFGYLNRIFVREGAEVLVNLSNDSWAHSVVSMMQHMGMAVFRAVENKRSLVRSTNGGITCSIDPDGRIRKIIKPNTQAYLVDDIPVYRSDMTFYTLWGDWFAWLMIIIVTAVPAAKFVYILKNIKKRQLTRKVNS